MAEILAPRPASTVLPLRDVEGAVEVLMLRRNLNSDFVGGAYVFPGGALDRVDVEATERSAVLGLGELEACERLNVDSGGLSYYVAALRELFEEAGLLVACHADGSLAPFDDPGLTAELAENRARLNARDVDFLDVLSNLGLVLDLRHVTYLAHWVTPVGPPRRFDTRFFVVGAPSGQVATHDAGETVANRWISPADALRAHEQGELEMILPTIRNLQSIAHCCSTQEVVAFARSRAPIERIEPRVVMRDGDAVILLPGDAGYED